MDPHQNQYREDRMLHAPRSIAPSVTTAVLVLAAAGCGSGSPGTNQAAATPGPSASPSASPSVASPAGAALTPSAAPSTASGKTITVRIAGGKVTPKSGRVAVARGAKVRLVVTSDVADEIHVHTYDLELQLKPGAPATLEFTADKTGLFEVETHETGLILFQLLVR